MFNRGEMFRAGIGDENIDPAKAAGAQVNGSLQMGWICGISCQPCTVNLLGEALDRL